MNQLEIVELLISKYNIKNTKYRIGLNGDWGIGKSFAWELFVKQLKENNDLQNLKDTKIIYCSLFGIGNINELKRELKSKKVKINERYSKVWNEKSESALNVIGKALGNKFLGGTVDIFELVHLDFNDDDYLVCFDDIERTSSDINISDVMGVIEQVAQTSKVLVIYNSKEMGEQSAEFQRQKEKILDYEYSLDTLSEETIDNIMGNYTDLHIVKKEAIVQFFKIHGKSNLRTLKKITNFINELDKKVPLNEEIIEVCSAVFIEEMVKPKIDKVLSVEEKSALELNPLLKYHSYKINYRAYSLIEEIEIYLSKNTIDESKFKEYISPAEKSEIIQYLNILSEGILKSEHVIKDTIKLSVDLLQNANAEKLNIPYIILLVGEMRFFDHLFNLGVIPENIEDIALDRIKELLREIEFPNGTGISLYRSPFYKLRIRNEVRPYVESLISKGEQYEVELKEGVLSTELNQKYSFGKFTECGEILHKNPILLQQNLYIFDQLTEPCSADYFNFIREVAEISIIGGSAKRDIRRTLFDLKRKVDDAVIIYRISLVIKSFLQYNYGKTVI